jgi:hypothetical protein
MQSVFIPLHSCNIDGWGLFIRCQKFWLLFGFFSITVYLSLFLFYSFFLVTWKDKKYD